MNKFTTIEQEVAAVLLKEEQAVDSNSYGLVQREFDNHENITEDLIQTIKTNGVC